MGRIKALRNRPKKKILPKKRRSLGVLKYSVVVVVGVALSQMLNMKRSMRPTYPNLIKLVMGLRTRRIVITLLLKKMR